jgi:hypothetical protein
MIPQKTILAHKSPWIERISQSPDKILRLLADDPHLETKRGYEAEPNRSDAPAD